MITSCNPSIFDGQNARTFLEQLRKPAGGGIADHLCNLPHGEICINEQMLCLTHSSPLNILRDAASELPLEAAFQLGFAHAGDADKALQRNIKGIVVGDVADHVLQALPVRI